MQVGSSTVFGSGNPYNIAKSFSACSDLAISSALSPVNWSIKHIESISITKANEIDAAIRTKLKSINKLRPLIIGPLSLYSRQNE